MFMFFLHHSPQREEMLHTITSSPLASSYRAFPHPKHLHQLSLASFSAPNQVIAQWRQFYKLKYKQSHETIYIKLLSRAEKHVAICACKRKWMWKNEKRTEKCNSAPSEYSLEKQSFLCAHEQEASWCSQTGNTSTSRTAVQSNNFLQKWASQCWLPT